MEEPKGNFSIEYLLMEQMLSRYDFSEADERALIKFRDMQLYGMYAENEKGERVNPVTFKKE